MRKATAAIALATLLPDWASNSDMNIVHKWLDAAAVLPCGEFAAAEYTELERQRRDRNFNGLNFDSRIWRNLNHDI